MTAIRFPWPDRRLSPNGRFDRRGITNVRRLAREEGFLLAKEAGLTLRKVRLQIRLLLCPPNRLKRDDDNVLTMFKSYRDGIFLALNMDDGLIRRTIIDWGEVELGGAIYVELKELETNNA